MKLFLQTALVAVFLCLFSGCSTLNTLGDYVGENPLFASIATRTAVNHYIAAGDSVQDEIRRAEQIQKRVTKALLFLEGDPNATVGELMAVIDQSIKWGELNSLDQALVIDIMRLVEQELLKHQERQPKITNSARIALVALFETAIDSARLYLER